MESSCYWQNFGEMMDRMFVDGAARRGPALMRLVEKKRGCGAIIYGGRLMSVDVYLAVPTFMRRGIMIVA